MKTVKGLAAFVFIFFTLSGCSEPLEFEEGVKVVEEETVIILDQLANSLIAVNVKVKNETGKKTEPFKVQINILNEKIASAMGKNEVVLGEEIEPEGEIFEIDEGDVYNIAGTFSIDPEAVSKEEVETAVKEGEFEVVLISEGSGTVTEKIAKSVSELD